MPGPVRRMLKDSSRFLLAGVRAALAEPVDATRQSLDLWHKGERQLVREPFQVLRLLSDAMAEVTVTAAQLGIDLLYEQPEQLPAELPLDAVRLSAAFEAILHAAMKEFGQDTTIHVRVLGSDRPALHVVAERPAARARLEARLLDPEQDLKAAAEIVQAHEGQLRIEGDADTTSIVVRL